MKMIITCSHGYISMTINEFKKGLKKGFVPTTYSMMSKSRVLLEEDVDAPNYMKCMYPDTYSKKWQTMKTTHQNTINHNKYMTIAITLEELEDKVAIYDKNNYRLGDKMITSNGTYNIKGYQKDGYVYIDDNGMWLMPFARIQKIEKVGH